MKNSRVKHFLSGRLLFRLILSFSALALVSQAQQVAAPTSTPNGERIIARPQRNGLATNQTQLVANGCDSGPGPDAVHQSVSYSAEAPDCGVPTVTVQTLTNPFSEPCLVFVYFSVDDDILIDGQMYQSPGTDFIFHDQADPPCPDANGAHSDQYCRVMDVG